MPRDFSQFEGDRNERSQRLTDILCIMDKHTKDIEKQQSAFEKYNDRLNQMELVGYSEKLLQSIKG